MATALQNHLIPRETPSVFKEGYSTALTMITKVAITVLATLAAFVFLPPELALGFGLLVFAAVFIWCEPDPSDSQPGRRRSPPPEGDAFAAGAAAGAFVGVVTGAAAAAAAGAMSASSRSHSHHHSPDNGLSESYVLLEAAGASAPGGLVATNEGLHPVAQAGRRAEVDVARGGGGGGGSISFQGRSEPEHKYEGPYARIAGGHMIHPGPRPAAPASNPRANPVKVQVGSRQGES